MLHKGGSDNIMAQVIEPGNDTGYMVATRPTQMLAGLL